MKFVPSLGLLLLIIAASTGRLDAQVLVNLDFETSGQLTSNFRSTYTNAATSGQTGNGAANDYGFVTATAVSGLRSLIFDTTPADATVKNTFSGAVQIELDIASGAAQSSFGIFLINPASESSSVHQLALFNWDQSSTSDLLRIFTSSQVSGGSTAGTQQYTSGNINSGANANSAFTHYTLVYRPDTVDPTRATLNLTVGTFNTGDILLAPGTYLSSFEIGMRVSANTNGNNILLDNFAVSQVPEPSLTGLFILGGLLLCSRNRCRC